MPKPLRLAVVSVHPLTRAGLCQLLDAEPERGTVVDTSSMDGHLAGHDVVVYDLAGLVGSAAGDLDHLLADRTPVLGLATLHRPDLVEGALAMGVAAVVPLSVTGPELLAAVERVATGDVVPQAGHWTLRHHLVRPARPRRTVDDAGGRGWRLRPPGP